MELNGALLNRPLPKEALLAQGLAAASAPVRAVREVPRRAGAVKDSVIQVLAHAGRPMRAREIHAAAEALAGAPLSWNTVKDYLHKQARCSEGPVRRVCYGVYESRCRSVTLGVVSGSRRDASADSPTVSTRPGS
jgi:hypothetical protein